MALQNTLENFISFKDAHEGHFVKLNKEYITSIIEGYNGSANIVINTVENTSHMMTKTDYYKIFEIETEEISNMKVLGFEIIEKNSMNNYQTFDKSIICLKDIMEMKATYDIVDRDNKLPRALIMSNHQINTLLYDFARMGMDFTKKHSIK